VDDGVPVTGLLAILLTVSINVPVPAGIVAVPDAVAAGCTVVEPEEDPLKTKFESEIEFDDDCTRVTHALPFHTSKALVVVLNPI